MALGAMLFLSAAFLFMFFLVLSGAIKHTTPFDKTYFLEARTQGIEGAREVSRWTFWGVCDNQHNCQGAHTLPSIGDAWPSNPQGAPSELVGSHDGNTTSYKYWIMWRFGWVFYLISMFFMLVSLAIGLLAMCTRIGGILAALSLIVALVFQGIASSLMTATFVKARNAFNRSGYQAKLGRWGFAWSWTAWFCLLVSLIMFLLSAKSSSTGNSTLNGSQPKNRKRGLFGRKRRSVGSDNIVKEEYT
jgi:hypothetical protein